MDKTPTPCGPPNNKQPAGRRTFLRLLTGLFGAVASAVLGLPLVGYFFGMRKFGVLWVDLGSVSDFTLNETRRLDFNNPLRQPWDGITSLTGVYARYQGKNAKDEEDRKSVV